MITGAVREIHIYGSQGFAPFEYSIDSGSTYQSSNDFTGLAGGIYDVVIKDDNGCTVWDTVHVDPINGVSIDQVNVTDEQSCNGDDGAIEIIASSGTTPYDYSIDGGSNYQGSNTFSGLAPGTYDVQVKDDNGCIDAQNVVVDSVPVPTVDAVNVTDEQTCNGNDGEIEIQASGGTTPYQYSIGVVVKGDNGCTVHDTAFVDSIPTPSLDSVDRSDLSSCTMSDGSIDVYASGGTTPYQYSIDSGSNYQGSSLFTGLSDGIYDVIVQDDNGCTAYDTVQLSAPDEPIIDSVDVKDLSCNGSGDGEITIHATNANEYSIDDGANFQAGNNFTGLSGGTYEVEVRNSAGCLDSTNVNVSEPAPLAIDSVDKDTAYCGGSGGLTIYASGGNSPYSYSVDNGSNFQSNNSFTGLSAGTYDIVVEDDSGCTASMTDDVPGSGALSVNVSTTDDTCNSNSGSATANVTGGTSPYTYDWSTGDTTQSISGLGQGSYDVVVTDPNGCEDSVGFTIYNNGTISASVTPQQTTICEGDTVTLNASGGTSYEWTDQGGTVLSNGSSVAVSPSSSSEYYATISNSSCTETDTVDVTVNSVPTTQVSPTDTTICNGDSVTLTASGGSSYNWNTGDTTQAITVAPSSAQTYTVVASNGNCQGNFVSSNVTVDQNPVAVANANDTVVALANGATVYFDNAGSTGSSFHWDFGDGTTANVPDTSHSYGATGTYTVILTAYLGDCVDKDTLTIHVNQEDVGLVDQNAQDRQVKIFPNPNGGAFDVQVRLAERGDMRIEVLNSVGKVIRSKELQGVRKSLEAIDLSDRSTGIYYVRVHGEHGVSVHKVSVVR